MTKREFMNTRLERYNERFQHALNEVSEPRLSERLAKLPVHICPDCRRPMTMITDTVREDMGPYTRCVRQLVCSFCGREVEPADVLIHTIWELRYAKRRRKAQLREEQFHGHSTASHIAELARLVKGLIESGAGSVEIGVGLNAEDALEFGGGLLIVLGPIEVGPSEEGTIQ